MRDGLRPRASLPPFAFANAALPPPLFGDAFRFPVRLYSALRRNTACPQSGSFAASQLLTRTIELFLVARDD